MFIGNGSPEDVSAVDAADKDTHRIESAIIVNSLVLAIIGLMLAARGFSAMGELMVELLYQLLSHHSNTEAVKPHEPTNATFALHLPQQKEQELVLLKPSNITI